LQIIYNVKIYDFKSKNMKFIKSQLEDFIISIFNWKSLIHSIEKRLTFLSMLKACRNGLFWVLWDSRWPFMTFYTFHPQPLFLFGSRSLTFVISCSWNFHTLSTTFVLKEDSIELGQEHWFLFDHSPTTFGSLDNWGLVL